MFAGAYHFSRPDIIASTLNSNGIANSGADEANHFMQMAGPWMRRIPAAGTRSRGGGLRNARRHSSRNSPSIFRIASTRCWASGPWCIPARTTRTTSIPLFRQRIPTCGSLAGRKAAASHSLAIYRTTIRRPLHLPPTSMESGIRISPLPTHIRTDTLGRSGSMAAANVCKALTMAGATSTVTSPMAASSF